MCIVHVHQHLLVHVYVHNVDVFGLNVDVDMDLEEARRKSPLVLLEVEHVDDILPHIDGGNSPGLHQAQPILRLLCPPGLVAECDNWPYGLVAA